MMDDVVFEQNVKTGYKAICLVCGLFKMNNEDVTVSFSLCSTCNTSE